EETCGGSDWILGVKSGKQASRGSTAPRVEGGEGCPGDCGSAMDASTDALLWPRLSKATGFRIGGDAAHSGCSLAARSRSCHHSESDVGRCSGRTARADVKSASTLF